MKQTIVVLGLIASTGSIFFLPNKTLADNGRSNQRIAAMAIRAGISGNKKTEANYKGTNENGEQEDIETGKNQAE